MNVPAPGLRFSSMVDLIKAEYPTVGDTQWFLGSEHSGRNDNWDRIVAYQVGGPIGYVGQGQPKGDTWHWVRRPVCVFEVWGATEAQTESRVHALLVALAVVFGTTTEAISELSETWPRVGVATAGRVCEIRCRLDINVVASDYAVVEDDAVIGAGEPLTAATGLRLNPSLSTDGTPPTSTAIPTVTVTPPEP